MVNITVINPGGLEKKPGGGATSLPVGTLSISYQKGVLSFF